MHSFFIASAQLFAFTFQLGDKLRKSEFAVVLCEYCLERYIHSAFVQTVEQTIKRRTFIKIAEYRTFLEVAAIIGMFGSRRKSSGDLA